MVIDDERDVLAYLDAALTVEGYRVTGVISGAEAVDLMQTDTPDIIILDLRMPDMNGIEILQSVRKSFPDMPVIVCSALRSYKRDFEIISGNVAAFLEKPIDFDRLTEVIAEQVGAPGVA
ncbi:response regulator [bacterium]|nr:response regulator [bacterium]